jgi:hypothetical protein
MSTENVVNLYFFVLKSEKSKTASTGQKKSKTSLRGSNDKNIFFFSNSRTTFTSVAQNLVRNTHKARTLAPKSLSKVYLVVVWG